MFCLQLKVIDDQNVWGAGSCPIWIGHDILYLASSKVHWTTGVKRKKTLLKATRSDFESVSGIFLNASTPQLDSFPSVAHLLRGPRSGLDAAAYLWRSGVWSLTEKPACRFLMIDTSKFNLLLLLSTFPLCPPLLQHTHTPDTSHNSMNPYLPQAQIMVCSNWTQTDTEPVIDYLIDTNCKSEASKIPELTSQH